MNLGLAGKVVGGGALGLVGACLGLWLATVLGRPVGQGVVGLAVGSAAVATLAWIGLRFATALAAGEERRRRTVALAVVLAVALGVRFVGLDHELVDRPYLDEGTYYRHAVQINAGEPFSASFVYPHLMYYADAFVLWAAEPFRPALGRVLGVGDPIALSWLLLRSLVALLGALTVWPAFVAAEVVMGRRREGDTRGRGAPGRGKAAAWSVAAPGLAAPGLAAPGLAAPGLAAPLLAGLLVAFGPLYNEVSHLNVADLPSAFFATVCLAACARLLEGESARRYLLAGAAAGLAAASKYPAGVVAVAVAAVWLAHRRPFRNRLSGTNGTTTAPDADGPAIAGSAAPAPAETRATPPPATPPPATAPAGHAPVETEAPPAVVAASGAGTLAAGAPAPSSWATRGGLLLAGLAALAVFVAATPSFLVFPEQAFTGGRGIFFGVRQYGGGGWIGVQPESNFLFYGGVILRELGLPAVLLGMLGLARLTRPQLVRLAWLLPFPVAYLLLITAMNMVVRRNLLPAVPALAVVAAAGAAALWERGVRPWLAARARGGGGTGARWAWRLRAAAAALLLALLVVPPASRSVADSVAMARPSTRELARAWLLENAAPGAAVVRESYGPELPAERFAVWKSRFAARFPLADLEAAQVDYLVLTSAAYTRFLDPQRHREPHHKVYGDWYRQVFGELPRVAEMEPSRWTWGPYVQVRRLPPAEVSAAPRRVPAARLFVPDGGMRRPKAVVFFRPGQWTLAKADLAPGRYRVSVEGAPGGGPAPAGGPGGAGDTGVREGAGAAGAATGELRLGRADGRISATVPLRAGTAEIEVADPGRLFLYLHLAEGSRVGAVRLEPARGSTGPPAAPYPDGP